MKVVKLIEAASLSPEDIERLANEAGELCVQRFRDIGFH